MSPAAPDPRTAAERIAADLRYQILAGELRPGDRVPSTEDLIRAHDSSSATVQRALAILKAEDLLFGRAGSGVYVRERELQTIHPADYVQAHDSGAAHLWIGEAPDRGQTGGSRIVDVTEVVPPRRVARRLELGDGERAVMRCRVGLLNDEPAELATSWYPLEIARGTRLADRRKVPGGSPRVLADAGLEIRGQYDEVTARSSTQREHELLALPGDVPVLEVLRVCVTAERRPVEVTELIKPGHLYRMGYWQSAG